MFPSVPVSCTCLRTGFVAFISVIATSLSAQTLSSDPHTFLAHPRYGAAEPTPTDPMPLVAPVFLQTDQIDSSITVVNALVAAVQGTITLRSQAGNILGKQMLSFPAHSSTPVAMRSILAAVGSQAHSGSVTLEQDSNVKAPALIAQLSMVMHAGSQASYLEEEFGMPSMHGSAVLRGVASQSRNLPLVAVTSVSEAA